MTLRTLLVLLICSYPLIGQSEPLATSNNSPFYYTIGGASSITVPPNAGVRTVPLRGSAELGIGYSCGKFDPVLGLSNLLNGLGNAGNDLLNGAIGAVTAAIGALPALILQRINPGLYDLFQNGLIRAEALLALASKSCEQMEYEIKQGKNPYKDWITLSKSYDWKNQMGNGAFGSSESDVVQAKEYVETNNGSKGVPWVGGVRAGGEDQPPIKTTEDVVKAGYNITMNRAPDSIGAPPGTGDEIPPRLPEIWATPEEAAQWAVDVVGDTTIHTYESHPTDTTSGHGLLPKVQAELTDVQEQLVALVGGASELSLDNLNAASSNDILITRDVIFAIQSLEPTEQGIAMNKLASEVAMSRTLEKALFIRRLLLTGKNEPNINQTPAPETVDETIAQLDQAIDNILFEKRVRKELLADTAETLLSLKAQHKNRGDQQDREAGQDEQLIIDGAVTP